MACATIDSPVGPLFISVEDGKVRRIEFGGDLGTDANARANASAEVNPLDRNILDIAKSELTHYFQGHLTKFSVPVEMDGPEFHKKVWDVLKSIPYGSTLTYAQIAERVGSPKAARAVGNACACNPVVIVVPCHRVLARGGLGGFGGGLDAKRWLLRHENYPLPPKY